MQPTRISHTLRLALLASVLSAAPSTPQDSDPALPPSAAPESSRTSAAPVPSRAERQFKTGLELAANNKIDAAIAVFTGLTRDYPRLPEPYQQLAALHAKRGELQPAVAALQNALRRGVQDSQLQEQLGDLYVQLAARAYQEAADAETPSNSARHKHSILQSVKSTPVPASSDPP